MGLSANTLPHMSVSRSCVVAGDDDGDGDLDLFVGGRVSPGEYPKATKSYLLNNNGKGIFQRQLRIIFREQNWVRYALLYGLTITMTDG